MADPHNNMPIRSCTQLAYTVCCACTTQVDICGNRKSWDVPECCVSCCGCSQQQVCDEASWAQATAAHTDKIASVEKQLEELVPTKRLHFEVQDTASNTRQQVSSHPANTVAELMAALKLDSAHQQLLFANAALPTEASLESQSIMDEAVLRINTDTGTKGGPGPWQPVVGVVDIPPTLQQKLHSLREMVPDKEGFLAPQEEFHLCGCTVWRNDPRVCTVAALANRQSVPYCHDGQVLMVQSGQA